MGVLIIRTADFKLAYRLMKALRRREIEFLQVSENAPLPHGASVWLGTPEEVFASKVGNGVPCTFCLLYTSDAADE